MRQASKQNVDCQRNKKENQRHYFYVGGTSFGRTAYAHCQEQREADKQETANSQKHFVLTTAKGIDAVGYQSRNSNCNDTVGCIHFHSLHYLLNGTGVKATKRNTSGSLSAVCQSVMPGFQM